MSTTTSANTRAEWERFVSGLSPESGVRTVILESWQRSHHAGVEPRPGKVRLRRVPDEDLVNRLRNSDKLIRVAESHLSWISDALHEYPHVAYVTDRDGIVLHAVGNAPQMREEFGLRPGYDWSEKAMGTNGAGRYRLWPASGDLWLRALW